ncbi:conserved protein of unknown function (plasmid) [Pararobbsia alpina]|uniref:hypothetical protein n=1 Tax=Pararobbsia alpina TaxID=621374 RepID=UPI0039A73E27
MLDTLKSVIGSPLKLLCLCLVALVVWYSLPAAIVCAVYFWHRYVKLRRVNGKIAPEASAADVDSRAKPASATLHAAQPQLPDVPKYEKSAVVYPFRQVTQNGVRKEAEAASN